MNSRSIVAAARPLLPALAVVALAAGIAAAPAPAAAKPVSAELMLGVWRSGMGETEANRGTVRLVCTTDESHFAEVSGVLTFKHAGHHPRIVVCDGQLRVEGMVWAASKPDQKTVCTPAVVYDRAANQLFPGFRTVRGRNPEITCQMSTRHTD